MAQDNRLLSVHVLRCLTMLLDLAKARGGFGPALNLNVHVHKRRLTGGPPCF